jgi:single-strand DNA-binding protein
MAEAIAITRAVEQGCLRPRTAACERIDDGTGSVWAINVRYWARRKRNQSDIKVEANTGPHLVPLVSLRWVLGEHPGRSSSMDARNMVALRGRLVKEPELRYLSTGTPVASFSIAVNRPVRKEDGTFEDTLVGFFDCELYGGTAVTLAEEHGKGAEVVVLGSLHQRKFETGTGPQARKVSKIEIKAKSVSPVLQSSTSKPLAPSAEPAPQPA